MIFVDTGFLVATLDPRDELHAAARDWASRTRGPFLATEYVLWLQLTFPRPRPTEGRPIC